jgi:hypothetical protein
MKKVLDLAAIAAEQMDFVNQRNMNNAISSRKSKAATKAREIKAQMLADAGDDKALIAKAKAYTYAHHIEKTRGCTVEHFESADYKGSKTSNRYKGKSSDRSTPEGKEANRNATNRSNFKNFGGKNVPTVLILSCATEGREFTMSNWDAELDNFIKKYTTAKNDMEFFSSEYKKKHKGCHTITGYEHLARFKKK